MFLFSGVALLSLSLGGTGHAPVEAVQPQPPSAYVGASIERWNSLRQTSTAPFETYASFILGHRNWPGEMDLRRKAERQIEPGTTGLSDVARFFAALPPLTAQGHAAHALALQASGQAGRAVEAARTAWAAGAMSEAMEQRLLTTFAGQLRTADHDQRIDALLSAGNAAAARRALAFGSAERRPIYEARLAVQARSPEAPALIASLGPAANRDPGLVHDRAAAMNRGGNPGGARQLLAQRGRFDRPPAEPEKLMELMVSLARAAANDGQSRLAYEIASKIDDIYPAGTDVSRKSYGERDEYTNLAWLAGWTALRNGRAIEAMDMFDRYGRAAASLQTRAKGFYWAARAATAAGQADRARAWLEQAAVGSDQFYGLLAMERLGRTPQAPVAAPAPTAAERAAFAQRPLVEAIRYLGANGRRVDQLLFVRALASSLDNDRDRVLAAEFGRSIGRLDMGVWAAREARSNGDNFYARQAFPEVTIPPAYRSHWAAAHGIMRQESSFERSVMSPVGARGMMQLMPGTAQYEARSVGVPYNLARLTEDADYNILIGSHHLNGLMERLGNNLVLVAVAYNAGAGRVPQWIARNGDFRTGGVDVVEWIENIPFSETRNYVQRVIENAMVYDLINPQGSRSGGRVSYFLGQRLR
ncbi:MAG TPA: lytic transglycosylase domain-containing protein [Allosphingosinicella sp.]